MPDSVTGDADVSTSDVTNSTTQDASAESSTASQGEGSLLDAVKAAVGKGAEGSPTSGTGTGTANSAPKVEGSEAANPEELTPEEQARLSERAQARFRSLANEVRDLREQVGASTEKAQRYDQLETFVREQNLDPKDIDDALTILVAFQRDPQYAYERLTALVDQLKPAVGAELPADLAEEVKLGYLSEPRAQEIARARASEAFREHRGKADAEQAKQREFREQWNARTEANRNALNDWESRIAAKDPDWPLKKGRFMELIELQVRRDGRLPEGGKVTELADRLLEQISTEFGRLRPQKQQVRPLSGSSSARTEAEPGTMLEAMKRAVR